MAQQITKKFLKDGSVDGSKIKLLQGQSIKGTNSLGQEVDLIKLGASDEVLVNGQEVAIKSVVDAQIAAETARATAAEDVLQDNIDSVVSDLSDEIARATAAEAAVQANLDTEIADRIADDTALQTSISTETAARIAADSSLQSNINTETSARIAGDAATLVSSKAYTDTKISEVMGGVAPETLDTIAEIAAALEDEQSAVGQILTQLADHESRIDTIEGILPSKLEQSDLDVEVNRATAAEAALQSSINSVASNLAAEVIRATAAEAGLQSSVNSNTSAIAALDSRVTDIETVLPDKADQSDLDIEIAARESADDALDLEIDNETAARIAADDVLQSNIDAEETRALAAEASLQSAITTETSARVSGDASTLSSANSYTDTKIAALVDSAPELLDTLKELADAIGDDPNFAATVATQVGQVQSNLTAEITNRIADVNAEETRALAAESALSTAISNEVSRAQAAEAALDSRVDALEAAVPAWHKMKKVLNSTDVSNKYVDLAHIVVPNSLSVFVDRLAIHQGSDEDYTLSVVGGVTRVTFVNDLVSPGNQSLDVNDTLYFKYQY
jgi:hypothetical protein